MVYLSELLRRRVVDEGGAPLGRVVDVVVQRDDLFPPVRALFVEGAGGLRRLPWPAEGDLQAAPLVVPQASAAPGDLQPGELRLRRDVLDRQIVDTKGRRVVKVNDLTLSAVRGEARLVGAERLARLLRLPLAERPITENFVEAVAGRGVSLRLTKSPSSSYCLHAADIAELVDDLSPEEGAALPTSLPPAAPSRNSTPRRRAR